MRTYLRHDFVFKSLVAQKSARDHHALMVKENGTCTPMPGTAIFCAVVHSVVVQFYIAL